jgi:hypothetical protein
MPSNPSQSEADLINSLVEGVGFNESYRGIFYNNSLLTGPGITDTYDPNMIAEIYHVGALWPGGVYFGNQNREFISTMFDDGSELTDAQVSSEMLFTRDLILGSSISDETMARYEKSVSRTDLNLIKSLGYNATVYTREQCIVRGAPSVVLFISRVLESEIIQPGEKLASVQYPSSMMPKPALVQLKGAIKRVIKDETI